MELKKIFFDFHKKVKTPSCYFEKNLNTPLHFTLKNVCAPLHSAPALLYSKFFKPPYCSEGLSRLEIAANNKERLRPRHLAQTMPSVNKANKFLNQSDPHRCKIKLENFYFNILWCYGVIIKGH